VSASWTVLVQCGRGTVASRESIFQTDSAERGGAVRSRTSQKEGNA